MEKLKQGSDEWFMSRIGFVAGSTVGAILGLSPFMKRDDVMRNMVREWHGSLSEFVGNVATEYGIFHEHLAKSDYEMKSSVNVESTDFHKRDNWIGASPDGLIGDDGLIEIKCPFSVKDDKAPAFKDIADLPHYYAQMQVQMFVTKRLWCDFVQWNKYDMRVQTVRLDSAWLNKNLPALRQFFDDYVVEREMNYKPHLEPRFQHISNAGMISLANSLVALKADIKAKQDDADKILQLIIEGCNGKDSKIGNHKLLKCKKAGAISYGKALKALLPDADLSDFIGSPIEYWRLT